MKTNDYLLITAVAGYSYLFYGQNAGINFLLFTTLFAILLAIRNKQLLRYLNWWWAAAISITGGVGVLLTSSALAIMANCFGLLLLAGISFNTQTSFIFSFLFSLYSIASSGVWVIIDAVNRLNKNEAAGNKEKNYKPLALTVVLLLVILFFAIYKESNPLFAENTKWINLDFISFNWIVFTTAGFFLVYALFYHKYIPPLEKWENRLSLNNRESQEAVKKLELEYFSAAWLFGLLNVMLIILNSGDITSIWFNAALPKGVTHSDFVHNGVGMIIISIIIATSFIIYVYRHTVVNAKYTTVLKYLIIGWIVQNIVMLLSTSIRNHIYIHDYNFTYRRIGVYAWLILAAIGLVITLIKIIGNKSNWFLIRTNFAFWFTFLAAGSLINWDIVITRYNLSNKPLKDVDFHYLFSLSDSNIPELLQVARRKDFLRFHNQLKNYTNNRFYYYDDTYISLLYRKVYHYAYDYKTDWQSWDLRDERINEALKGN